MAYGLLSTRNENGLWPGFRGLGFLGDASTTPLSPTDALMAALAAYSGSHVNPNITAPSSAWMSAAESAVANASIDVTGGLGPNCAGQQAQPLNLLKTTSGLALSATTTTTGILAATSTIPAAAVPIVGWIVAGVGALVSLIGAIFEHHAKAVARDLQFGCSAVPAVNNAMAVIIKGVGDGTILPGDAANALAEVYSQFMAAGGASGSASGPGGIPSGGKAINDSPFCNSNCELSIIVYAMVLYWTGQFQAQAQQAAAVAAESAAQSGTSQGGSGVPGIVSSPAAPGTLSQIPAWGWIALALFGAWAVAG